VNGSSLRNLDNRLKKLHGFAFEVLEDDSDLAEWAEGFCDAHERRWNPTSTPSEYRFPEERRRFVAKLVAWCRSGILVRFALKVGNERIVLLVGLVASDRLVYHHVSFTSAYAQYSPSTVLLRRVVLWMGERGMTTLDFGSGGEGYKKRFADVDEPLWRVIAASRRLSTMFARSIVERRIRSSVRTQTLWDTWANLWFRGTVASTLDRGRSRLRRMVVVDARQNPRVLLGRARTRLLRERMIFYRATADHTFASSDVVSLDQGSVLAMLAEEVALDARGRARYLDAMSLGQRPFGVIEGGRVAQVCWLRQADVDETVPHVSPTPSWAIVDCVTARKDRGRGLYPRVLRALRAVIPSGDACVAYTNDWNHASQRGIEKAGYVAIAIRERARVEGHVRISWHPIS